MTDLPERYLDDMDDRTQMDGEPIEKTDLERALKTSMREAEAFEEELRKIATANFENAEEFRAWAQNGARFSLESPVMLGKPEEEIGGIISSRGIGKVIEPRITRDEAISRMEEAEDENARLKFALSWYQSGMHCPHCGASEDNQTITYMYGAQTECSVCLAKGPEANRSRGAAKAEAGAWELWHHREPPPEDVTRKTLSVIENTGSEMI